MLRLDPAPCDYVVVGLDAEPREVAGRFVTGPWPTTRRCRWPRRATSRSSRRRRGPRRVPGRRLRARAPHARGLWSGRARRRGPHALAGPVGRLGRLDDRCLDPGEEALEASRRAARSGPRPVPARGEVRLEPRVELFWSLAFAVAPATHARIGGFDRATSATAPRTPTTRSAPAPPACRWPGWRRLGAPPAPPRLEPAGRAPVRHRAQRTPSTPCGARRADGRLAGRVEQDAGLIRWHEHGARLEVVAHESHATAQAGLHRAPRRADPPAVRQAAWSR